MAKVESTETFIKNFGKLDDIIKKQIGKDWNLYTSDAFGFSQDNVPVWTGELRLSGDKLKARITIRGVESSIVYKVPYAGYVHDHPGPLRSVPGPYPLWLGKGNGTVKQKKSTQGEPGFLDKGIKKATPLWYDKILDAIADAYINKI